MQLSITADSTINVHTSGPGDYVVKFSVSDGRGGVTDSNVTLHVPFDAPVVSVQPNAIIAATPGAPLTLDFAPTNGNALPATYTLTGAPTDMAIDESGHLTWTPTENPFFNASEATATVTVSNADHVIDIPVSIHVRSTIKSFPLVRIGLMTPTNDGGMKIGDFDGDNKTEILVTDNARLLYSLQNSNGTYKQNWVFPYDICGQDITATAPLKRNLDGSRDIAVQCSDVVAIIKYGTDQVLRRTKIRETNIYGSSSGGGIVAADLDGDGKEELAILINNSGSAELIVLDAATLVEKWRSEPMAYVSALAVGNVDNDAALEIVVSGGYSAGYVFDGITHAIQWTYSPGFGERIAIGDVDGDGIDDIIGAGAGVSSLRTYSAVLQSPVWETPLSAGICSIALTQLDGDAAKEIVVGSCQNQTVTAYDVTSNGPVLKRTDSVGIGYGDVKNIVVGDTNDDGHLDMALIANLPASSTKAVTVYDLSTQTVLFPDQNTLQLRPPYVGGYSQNIGGSIAAIFAANVDYNYGNDARVVFMNAVSGELEISPTITQSYNSTFDICLTDYDLDGQNEILFSTFNSYSPFFAAIDPVTKSTKWSKTLNNYSNSSASISCGDLNGDGHPDVVRANDNRVIAYDIFNDQQIWGGFTLNSTALKVIQADLDGDGKNEIVAITWQDLIIYGALGNSYIERGRYTFNSYSTTQVLVSDLDGDHIPEIILAKPDSYTGNYTLIVFDKNLTQLRSFSITGTVTAIGEIGDGSGKLLIATTVTNPNTGVSKYLLSQFDAITGSQDWQSPPLIGPVASGNLHRAAAESSVPERLMLSTSNAMYITR
ncbi:MAG: hypothetical protein JWM78_3565 [Verrucomicrobiaceae bacterium]|nr:hypothetical protein [Verrucomicrobiaceae bacterium]